MPGDNGITTYMVLGGNDNMKDYGSISMVLPSSYAWSQFILCEDRLEEPAPDTAVAFNPALLYLPNSVYVCTNQPQPTSLVPMLRQQTYST